MRLNYNYTLKQLLTVKNDIVVQNYRKEEVFQLFVFFENKSFELYFYFLLHFISS